MIRFVRSGPLPLAIVVVVAFVGAGLLLRARLAPAARATSAATAAASDPAAVSIANAAASSASESDGGAPGAATAASSVPPEPALPELPAHAKVDPRSETACPRGMVLVEGTFCPAVAHFCEEWVGDDPTASRKSRGPKRCRRYKKKLVCEGDLAKVHVCIDRFEYPNLVGVRPAILTTYRDAERACQAEGKRLCDADEWALACEGTDRWPYPNGLERDPKRCAIDRTRRTPNVDALARPADVSLEVERLDQRAPSGSNPGCASRFGVHDLVGNVAEWVHDRHGQRGAPRSDIALAGGGWESATSTCREVEGVAKADAASYLSGFRCCADALDGEPARTKR